MSAQRQQQQLALTVHCTSQALLLHHDQATGGSKEQRGRRTGTADEGAAGEAGRVWPRRWRGSDTSVACSTPRQKFASSPAAGCAGSLGRRSRAPPFPRSAYWALHRPWASCPWAVEMYQPPARCWSACTREFANSPPAESSRQGSCLQVVTGCSPVVNVHSFRRTRRGETSARSPRSAGTAGRSPPALPPSACRLPVWRPISLFATSLPPNKPASIHTCTAKSTLAPLALTTSTSSP